MTDQEITDSLSLGSSIHAHALEAKLNQRTPLFRGAIIQSGAVGCLGPVSIDRANGDQNALCRHMGIIQTDGASRLAALREISAEQLVQASREMDWATYPLVNDELTLKFTDQLSPILVDLGETRSVTAELGNTGPIAVMLGEVDSEVCRDRFTVAVLESCFFSWRLTLCNFQGSIFTRELSSLMGYEDVRTPFSKWCATSSTAERAMELYGLTPDVSLDIIRDRLCRFFQEIHFSYPLSMAYKVISQNQNTKDAKAPARTPPIFHDTTAERYKINFGNPFPAPIHGISHHCVDLIYIFNAFHDHLLQADKSSKASPGSEYQSDEGLVPKFKEPSPVYPDNVSRANDDLRKEIQEKWINFIVDDHTKSDGGDNKVLLYGRDRVSRKVVADEDSSYMEQLKRFEFVGEHISEMQAVFKAITGSTSSGRSD